MTRNINDKNANGLESTFRNMYGTYSTSYIQFNHNTLFWYSELSGL